MNTVDCIRESNRIEGILRDPSEEEIAEHNRFMCLPCVTIPELEQFVRVYQPGARLRSLRGLDVRVGGYIPPCGGAHITEQLQALLNDVNTNRVRGWDAHLQYENLHPFTDGNGRSGRVLWYWMMRGSGLKNLGFLHAFYYQTLRCAGKPKERTS